MNQKLIENWNRVVRPEDTIYYLGDFSLAFRAVETISTQLNGTKYLVPGNHDFCHSYHKKSRKLDDRQKWINKYKDYGWIVLPEIYQLNLAGLKLTLCHHPFSETFEDKYAKWRPTDKGSPLICGHVHEKWNERKVEDRSIEINVGVDANDYRPVSLEEIIIKIK